MDGYLLTDDLIWRLRKREKAIFQLLFEYYYRPLCLFGTKIIHDRDAAEDIVQEAFVNFWKHDMTGFPNIKTVKTFLYNSVQNRSLNYLRDINTRNRNYQHLEFTGNDEEHFIYHQIQSEITAEVFAAIEELPDRCREIFKMAYIDEQEEKEIATLLNVSVNTIKTQKLRAKNYLKGRLGKLFVFAVLIFPNL